jgi:hypothetical protein
MIDKIALIFSYITTRKKNEKEIRDKIKMINKIDNSNT